MKRHISFKIIAIVVASIFLFNELSFALGPHSRLGSIVEYDSDGTPVAIDPAGKAASIRAFQDEVEFWTLIPVIGRVLFLYGDQIDRLRSSTLLSYIERKIPYISKTGKLKKLSVKNGEVFLTYRDNNGNETRLKFYLTTIEPQPSPRITFSLVPEVSKKIWIVCEEEPGDGFVRKGTKAWEIFKKRLPVIQTNKITDVYKDRIIALLERTLSARERVGSYIRIKRRDGTFEQREEEQRRVLSQLEKALIRLKQPSFQIYGFKGIVVETNDFILDHCYWYGNKLFLATDLIAWLEAHGPPDSPVIMSLLRKGEGPEEPSNTLVDEFLLHTILCSILQDHERAIVAAQGIFPGHYTNPRTGPNIIGNYGEIDGIKYKIDQKGTITFQIFKGLLGDRLRKFIDEKVSELPIAAASTIIEPTRTGPTLTAATPILPVDVMPPPPLELATPAARQPLAPIAPKESVLIGGKYRVIKLLGEGGMGKVFLAEDTTLGRKVAIKTIKMIGAGGAEFIERFIREAKAVAKLRHPNIIQVHEIGEFRGAPYYVMDYVEGESLDKLITPVSEGGLLTSISPFDIERIKIIAEALEYAHNQGIIHRDIKPSNIIIDEDGKPYLTDFGLAKDIKKTEGETLTATGAAVGTPQYMSPEQARGEGDKVDKRSDVYSLGAALYEVVTLQRPYEGVPAVVVSKVASDDPANEPPTPRSINPNISPILEAVIMKAMAKNPDERYNSAGEFAEDIGRYLKGEPTKARPLTRVKKFTRLVSRNKTLVIIGSVAILLILAIGSAGIYYKQLSDEKARQAQIVAQQAEEARKEAEKKDKIEREKQTRTKDAGPHISQAKERRSRLKETAGRISSQDYRRGLEALLDSLNKAISVYERRPQDSLIPEVLPDLPPEWAEAYLERGKVMEELDDEEAALSNYRRALELNDKLVEAYVRIGNIYRDKGMSTKEDYDVSYKQKAREMYQRALDINPDSDQGRLARAQLHLLDRNYEQALDILNRLIGNYKVEGDLGDFPSLADAYLERAHILSGWSDQIYYPPLPPYRDMDQALKDYQRYLELEPTNPFPKLFVGWVYGRMGRWEQGEAEINKVLELKPRQRQLILSKRVIFYRDAWQATRNVAWRDKTESDFVELCLLDPENIEFLWRTAKFYWMTGNFEKEKEYFKKAMDKGHGTVVTSVEAGSQAETWGIRKGDIILDVGLHESGRWLRATSAKRQAAWIERMTREGKPYRLGITILRDGEIIRIQEVEVRPESWGISVEDVPDPRKSDERQGNPQRQDGRGKPRQQNDRSGKRQLPQDIIAQNFIDVIRIQSMDGHGKGKVLIGIDTSWIPARDGVEPLLSAIKDLSEPLGLDNILVAIGRDAKTLYQDMERVKTNQKGQVTPINPKNIIILGPRATIESDLFNSIRGEGKACFVGINSRKLKKLKETTKVKDARLLEIIEVALELAFSSVKIASLKNRFSRLKIYPDRKRPRTFIVIPDAEEMDIEEYNRINQIRAKIVSSA